MMTQTIMLTGGGTGGGLFLSGGSFATPLAGRSEFGQLTPCSPADFIRRVLVSAR